MDQLEIEKNTAMLKKQRSGKHLQPVASLTVCLAQSLDPAHCLA